MAASRQSFLSVALVVLLLLAAGLAAVHAAGAGQPAAAPAAAPIPLPNDCQDVTGSGEEPPACCIFGYVYADGAPAAAAQVTIRSAHGVLDLATKSGAASPAPYYAASLSDAPLSVAAGDTITVTATFAGAGQDVVYRVAADGQQVDVVIPAPTGERPPIATIHAIRPGAARQDADVIAFDGGGADQDEDGASVVAWEWSSSLDGPLSDRPAFRRAASALSVGLHAIALRVQDDEGAWSEPVTRTLAVAPPLRHSYWFPYLDADVSGANCYDRRDILASTVFTAQVHVDLNFNGLWDGDEPVVNLSPSIEPQLVYNSTAPEAVRLISDRPLQTYAFYNLNDCGIYDDAKYQYAPPMPGDRFVVPLTGGIVHIVATVDSTTVSTPGGATVLDAGQRVAFPAVAGAIITADQPVAAALLHMDHARMDASLGVALQPAGRAGSAFWVPPRVVLQATVLRDDSRLLLAYNDGTVEARAAPAAPAFITTAAPAALYWLADITTADPWDGGALRRFQELWAIPPAERLGTEYANAGYLLSAHDDNLIRIDGDYDGVYERQVVLQAGEMLAPYTRFPPPHPHPALYTLFVGHVRATYPVYSWQVVTGNWTGTDEHLYGTEHQPIVTEERVAVQPGSIAATLPQGQSTAITLTLSNPHSTALSFAVVEEPITPTVDLTAAAAPNALAGKVDPALAQALAAAPDGRTTFLVYLGETADLSAAAALRDWTARGAYVVARLQKTASVAQDRLLGNLHAASIPGYYRVRRAFWIVNALEVEGDRAAVDALAGRPDVAYLEAAPGVEIPDGTAAVAASPPQGVEWNVSHIGAERAWREFGVTGAGVVVGAIDTGADASHPALSGRYRGTATGSHDFNWYDPTGAYPNAPGDNTGHGTHVVGIMVGDDTAGNQIGVAPGATWIAAKGCATDQRCEVGDLLLAAQWMLAPCPVGVAPGDPRCDPGRQPQVINNSWGSAGGDRWYAAAVAAWRAAGIFPVFAAGKNLTGASCNSSIYSPADYGESCAVGASDAADAVAWWSGRGPSRLTPETKPDVVAPGERIRSAAPGGGYVLRDGTSMASPHAAGVAALLLQANPALAVGQIEALLLNTAVDLGRPGPDCDAGYGRLNAYGAVAAARDPLPWLSVSPASGNVPPHGAQVITVTLNAAGLEARPYAANLILTASAPRDERLIIPVALTVTQPLPQITGVRVSNLSDTSVSISWLTTLAADGEVRYGTQPAALTGVARDDRGAAVRDGLHHVTLRGLAPRTTYYFSVSSDGVADAHDGAYYTFSTGAPLDAPDLHPVRGRILQDDGVTPVAGALVYIQVADSDRRGSPAESALLTALTDAAGWWYDVRTGGSLNLAAARTADGGSYFSYTVGADVLRIQAEGGTGGCRRHAQAQIGDEAVLPDVALSCASLMTLDIRPPRSVFVWPRPPAHGMTARELLDAITAQGGQALELDRWQPDLGDWDGLLRGQPGGDFPTIIQVPYFLRADRRSLLEIQAAVGADADIAPGAPITLTAGWNFIALPWNVRLPAARACEQIGADGATCIHIARWDANLGDWITHSCGATFGSFAMTPADGYFVGCRSGGVWTPRAEPLSARAAGDETGAALPLPAPSADHPVIRGVRIANRRDVSVAFSWLTDLPATGYVRYGTAPAALTETAYDDRGTGTVAATHHVTLRNLAPETTYYAVVISGQTTDDNGGQLYRVATGPVLSIPAADPAYGRVFLPDGVTPAAGALVYLDVQDTDGGGSSGQADRLSAVADEAGYWRINLGGVRTVDGASYFTYSAGDRVWLTAWGPGGQRVEAATSPAGLAPAPTLRLQTMGVYLPLVVKS